MGSTSKKGGVLAVIPARGGSRGLPRKNIRPLRGRPLIAYSIEAALNAKSVGRVVVSTDDREIASIAASHGAEVPFMRPADLALDTTPDRPVLLHALDWLEKNGGYSPDAVVLLRPTTPLKTPGMIDGCIKLLAETPALTSVRTVTRVEGVFHPYWMYKADGAVLKPFMDGMDVSQYYQRQLLPPCFRLNGVVDALRAETVRNCPDLFGPSIGFVDIGEERAVDIDNQHDLDLCEFMMERLSG